MDLEKSYVFKYKNVGLRPLRIYKIEYDASMMDVDYRDITKARSNFSCNCYDLSLTLYGFDCENRCC